MRERERIIAKRYGKAVCELALELKDAEDFERDISILKSLIDKMPGIVRVFSDERVDIKRRRGAIHDICRELKLVKPIENLLSLLMERGKIGLLPAVLDEAHANILGMMKL